MIAEVVDTNVAIVANNREPNASPSCVLACVAALRGLVDAGMLVIDDGDAILSEYRRYLSPSGQPGVGDEFMRWIFNHLYNPSRCERVRITPVNGSFSEFPDDPDLNKFDRSDRKFVAVALASTLHPSIVNAVDSDYALFGKAFAKHGVSIRHLCGSVTRKRRGKSSKKR